MNTFEPMEFKNYQRNTGVEQVKLINIKPGKSNMHVKVVRDALYKMYPHANGQGLYEYDAYMQKAVKKFQQEIGVAITGILTEDELKILADKSKTFRVV